MDVAARPPGGDDPAVPEDGEGLGDVRLEDPQLLRQVPNARGPRAQGLDGKQALGVGRGLARGRVELVELGPDCPALPSSPAAAAPESGLPLLRIHEY